MLAKAREREKSEDELSNRALKRLVQLPALLGDRWFSLFDGNRSGVRGVMST